MQTYLIFVLFVLALGYLGWRAYQSFRAKKAGCGTGCGCAPDVPTAKRRAVS